MRKLTVALSTLLFCLCNACQAAVIHVPGDKPTIAAAVAAAGLYDTVLLADGVYTGPGNRNVDTSAKLLTFASEHGPGATTIDLQHLGRAFIVQGWDNVQFRGLTIRNGIEDQGGAIAVLGSAARITGCRFIENQSDVGGAIFASASGVDINDSTFVRNRAFNPTFGAGGAIELQYSESIVQRCRFFGNVADDPNEHGFGGAIDALTSVALVTDCTFVGNTAFRGSAVFAIADDGLAVAIVTFCTLSDNPSGYGALYGIDVEFGFVEAFNCVFRSSFPNTFLPPSYSDWIGSGGYPQWNIIDANPRFVANPWPGADGLWGTTDDNYGDLHLQSISQCINTGSANGLDAAGDPLPAPPATDLDGNPRIIGPAPDMGAYEASPLGISLDSIRRRPGEVAVTVRLRNTGNTLLREMLITEANLGGIAPRTALPIVIRGGLAPGQTVTKVLVFPESVGPPGAVRSLHVKTVWAAGYGLLDLDVVLP